MRKYTTPEIKELAFMAKEMISVVFEEDESTETNNDVDFGDNGWD